MKALIIALLCAGFAACGWGATREEPPAATREEPPAATREEPPAATREERPRLFLAGDGELWVVDVIGERVRRLPMPIGPGDPPVRILRRGRELVVLGDDVSRLDPHHPRRRLQPIVRDGWFFLASAHPDRVWVATRGVQGPVTVREVAVDRKVTVPDAALPRGAWPELAVGSGLLFLSRRDDWVLWNPSTRRVVRRRPYDVLGSVGAAYGDLISSCREPCTAVRLTEMRTGRQRSVPAPDGWMPFVAEGAFSPDGGTLAIPVQRRLGGPARLALVDVARGRIRLVGGSTVPAGYVMARWSRSGGFVFITGGERFRGRTIVAYRVGEPRARRLHVRVGDFYDAEAY